MQHYYQGSMRCKDFLPFLMNTLESHGWKIAGRGDNQEWGVVQKLASTGGIMTVVMKEGAYPNYGRLSISVAMSLEATVDSNGVFVSAYNPITQDAYLVYGVYQSGSSTYYEALTKNMPTATDDCYRTTNGLYPYFAYYSTGKIDTDDEPLHVFYILSVDEDGFFIKVRGNPAITGNISARGYLGAFDKLLPEIDTNNPVGLWGVWHGGQYSTISKQANGLDTLKTAVSNYWARDLAMKSYFDYYYEKNGKYPAYTTDNGHLTSLIFISNSPQHPVLSLPKRMIQAIPSGDTLIDENVFLELDGDKYVYLTGYLVRAMSSVRNLQLDDTGTGYQLTWVNPVNAANQIKIYAKNSGLPTAHDDPDATLVTTINNPVPGDVASYIDTTHYGQETHYAVFAFDDAPTPNVSILSPQSSGKIAPIIASFASPLATTVFNPSLLNYDLSNDGKINAFYSPVAAYPCNDNADDTIVTDIIGGLNGVSSANTALMSVPAQIGTGLNLAGNRFITIPASTALSFPYSYTIQGWFKRPTTGADSAFFSADTNNSAFRLNTTNGTLNFTASATNVAFPYKYDWTDTDNFMLWSLVKKGAMAYLYLNGELAPVNYINQSKAWNPNGAATSIGRQATSFYFNGAVNGLEFYNYPLSRLQMQYSHAGHLFDPAFYGYASIDGMAIISDVGAVNEQALASIATADGYSPNLSGVNNITVDCYSTRAGNIFSLVLANQRGLEFVIPITTTLAKSWETVSLDISSIQNDDKRDIEKIGIKIVDATEVNIISIKNIVKA